MKYLKLAIAIVFLGFLTAHPAQSQNTVIDEVVAVIGNKIIKKSDIETQYLQIKAEGNEVDKCHILEVMMRMKLMVNQAAIDSVEITESQVEGELNQRLNMMVSQFGEQEIVKHYGKTILEMKDDMRNEIRDNMISQRMEEEVAGNITITPSEVKSFYNKLNKDSLPLINAQIELYQIGVYPPYTEQAIFDLKEKMLDLRRQIIEGKSFASLAVLYSEDGSAMRGGELGFTQKGSWDPEFAKAAFALKERGEVSKIVESQFGYHLIQLIEKRGDMVNARHILMKPKADAESVTKAVSRLDSIADLIRKDSVSFEKAALYFSEDKSTRFNSGLVMNPQTGEPKFEMDQINPVDYRVVKDLKVGEISEPYESMDEKGKKIFKIVMIKSRSNPHRANLKDDFDLLKNMALANKRNNIINEWIDEKIESTYIHIDDKYKNCNFSRKAWIK